LETGREKQEVQQWQQLKTKQSVKTLNNKTFSGKKLTTNGGYVHNI
jgi:hypothetical protein